MEYCATSPAPEKSDPTAKNRVWGNFGDAPKTSWDNVAGNVVGVAIGAAASIMGAPFLGAAAIGFVAGVAYNEYQDDVEESFDNSYGSRFM